MMQLWLMRHGHALSTAEAGVSSDADRPLSATGREAVGRAVGVLRSLGAMPDHLLASPLARARQTAQRAAEALGLPGAPVITECLSPGHNPAAVLAFLTSRRLDGIVLAVGHQPLLGHLASELAFGEARDSLDLEPSALCVIHLPDYPHSFQGRLHGLWNPRA